MLPVAQDGLKSELTAKSPAELKQQVIATLMRLGQILDAKAPADAAAFKAWLNHIAEQVAAAASEGGSLGFGGVKVTDAERALSR
jgi:cytochrome c556